MSGKINKNFSKKIKSKYKIQHEYKNTYAYFEIAKTKIYIEYLNSIGIKNTDHEKSLSKLLYEKCNETKVNNLWIVGAIVALVMPIWSKIIDLEMQRSIKTSGKFLFFYWKYLLLLYLL